MVFVFFKAPSLTCLDGDGGGEIERERESERAREGGREGV